MFGVADGPMLAEAVCAEFPAIVEVPLNCAGIPPIPAIMTVAKGLIVTVT